MEKKPREHIVLDDYGDPVRGLWLASKWSALFWVAFFAMLYCIWGWR